jgi:hypothetical protein
MLPSQEAGMVAPQGKIVSHYRQDGLYRSLSILRILMHHIFQGLIAIIHIVDILRCSHHLYPFG